MAQLTHAVDVVTGPVLSHNACSRIVTTSREYIDTGSGFRWDFWKGGVGVNNLGWIFDVRRTVREGWESMSSFWLGFQTCCNNWNERNLFLAYLQLAKDRKFKNFLYIARKSTFKKLSSFDAFLKHLELTLWTYTEDLKWVSNPRFLASRRCASIDKISESTIVSRTHWLSLRI